MAKKEKSSIVVDPRGRGRRGKYAIGVDPEGRLVKIISYDYTK